MLHDKELFVKLEAFSTNNVNNGLTGCQPSKRVMCQTLTFQTLNSILTVLIISLCMTSELEVETSELNTFTQLTARQVIIKGSHGPQHSISLVVLL